MGLLLQLSTALLTLDTTDRIVKAEGNPESVLGHGNLALIGRTLWDVLGVDAGSAMSDAEPTRFIRGQREGNAVHFRLQLGMLHHNTRAVEVCDLNHLLAGAPPIQISRLSSSLSHEIRNPLSSVKMAVQTLARNPDHSPRDQRRLNIAQREIRTLERMLALLSEYGRDTPGHLEPFSLRALTQEAIAAIEIELRERPASIELEESEPLPKVLADSNRMRPVLAQLLWSTAVGQEPSTPVQVRLLRAEAGAALVVEDRAATLLPEERATLFEPFGSRLARGAGLSLAALRRVMLSQGGQVTAEPAGTGTLFTLTFAPA